MHLDVLQSRTSILLKVLRNCISDTGAELIALVSFLEPPFVALGPVCSRLTPLNIFYRRTMKSLCDRWKRNGNHFRKLKIDSHEFIFDVTDFTVCSWYFYRQLFERETTRLILNTINPGEIVLDIGSNRGYISVLAALKVGPNGRVFCFEPNPDVYRELQEHIRLNRLEEHIVPSTLALSNCCSSEEKFFVSNSKANSGLSSLTPYPELLASQELSHANTIPVETITLDVWVKQHAMNRRIDLIKVDVEGAEMLVLEGAKETLATLPPKRWVIETQVTRPVVEFMKAYGYDYKILDPAGDHANFVFEDQSCCNLIMPQ